MSDSNAIITPPQMKETLPANTDAMTLIGRAITSGASVENIDKLIELVKFNDEREAVRAFNAAFTEAQSEFPVIPKTEHVKFKTSKGVTEYWHAHYSKEVELLSPVLKKHGFSFHHETDQVDGSITVTCVLAHKLGHSVKSTMSSGSDASGGKNAIQAVGSTRSYLKRYTLEDVTGLSTGDMDDDGRSSEEVSQEIEFINENQVLAIEAAIEENSLDKEFWLDKIEKATGDRSFTSITASGYSKVWSTLQKAIKAQSK